MPSSGVLAVATNQSRNINFYSTIRPVTELVSRTPFHTITVADPVKSLTWKIGSGSGSNIEAIGAGQMQTLNLDTTAHCNSNNNNKSSSIETKDKEKNFLRSNRLLVATTAGFADMDVIESVGLGQGTKGCVAVGAGKHMGIVDTSMWGSSTNTDIEALMGSRCTAGYSIDAGKNLQVLSDEMDALLAFKNKESRSKVSTSHATVSTEVLTGSMDTWALAPLVLEKTSSVLESSESSSPKESEDRTLVVSSPSAASSSSYQSDTRRPSRQVQVLALSRLWAWVDRVESLSSEGMSVSFCGVINLLASSVQSTACSLHKELGVSVYSSDNRNLAKELCGWTKMELDEVAESQQVSGEASSFPASKPKIPEMNKGRTTSSDHSHDSLHSGGGKSQGSVDDELNDSASEKDQRGAGLRGSKIRSEKDSLSSSSVSFDPMSELEAMVAECEEADCFERAAAVALFHGNLTLAVRVLQRHILASDSNRRSGGSGGDSPFHSQYLKVSKESSTVSSTGANNNKTLVGTIADSTNTSDGDGASQMITCNGTAALLSDDTLKSDTQYIQLISLTAMCIAGFSNNNSISGSSLTTLSPQQEMWASMCKHVVTQLELRTDSESEQRISSCCYLAAALRFLLDSLSAVNADRVNSFPFSGKGTMRRSTETVGVGVKYGCVINDDRLSLEDRVSFALTFLDDHETLEWLQIIKDDCTLRGDLGGLVVTGLSGEGLNLLQQYLDRHDDLQTVALLVGRNVIDNAAGIAAAAVNSGTTTSGGSSSSQVRSREWQWLWEYRNLLNKMQLFVGRASLDVQLGRRNRLIARPGPTVAAAVGTGDVSASSTRTGPNSNIPYGQGKLRQTQPPGAAGRGGGSAIDRKSGSARVLYQLPPHSDLTHVFLRCNYCSSSLPVDPMQQQQAAFFRKQRPLINCCANCKKPLPRCYVCLLYMGLVNPTHGKQ